MNMSAAESSNNPADSNSTERFPALLSGSPLDFGNPEFQRFLHYQQQALEDCLKRINVQEIIKHEYETLRYRLSTIADQTRYPTVVALGPHALFSGELLHTNEVLVFLGDNYFVERTSTQAAEVATRRIAKIQANLDKLSEEKNFLQSRLNLMANLVTHENADDIVEIHEPLVEEAHRESATVRFDKIPSDEDIKRRLDELEAEENQAGEDDEEDEANPKHLVPPVNARPRRSSLPSHGDNEKKQRKSVSFAPFEGPVPERERKEHPMFKQALRMRLASGKFQSMDVDSMDQNDWFPQPVKSVSSESVLPKLRKQNKVDSLEIDQILDTSLPVVDTGEIVEKNMEAFEVTEAADVSVATQEDGSTKPVSRFKANRAQLKSGNN